MIDTGSDDEFAALVARAGADARVLGIILTELEPVARATGHGPVLDAWGD